MRVKVKLFATLSAHVPGIGPGTPFDVDLPAGSRLSDLAEKLRLPESEARVAFVNGRTQPFEYELQDNDEVGIFPPIGGG